MSIASIKTAFQEGLGDAGSCLKALMSYERGETPGQRLAFTVALPSGTTETYSTLVPYRSNLVEAARAYGSDLKTTLQGG